MTECASRSRASARSKIALFRRKMRNLNGLPLRRRLLNDCLRACLSFPRQTRLPYTRILGGCFVRRTTGNSDADRQEDEQIFRYWVEVRDLTNGSVLSLPLSAVARIHIPRKKNEAQRPREEILRLQDGSAILEATSLDDLAAQLRQKYPDSGYERTLHRERDRDAEERRAEAMNQLIRILAEAVVRGTL